MTSSIRRALTAVVLVVAAVGWAAVNKPVEGPTVLLLTHRHGLTVGDLPSVAALIVAVLLVLPVLLRRRRGPGRSER